MPDRAQPRPGARWLGALKRDAAEQLLAEATGPSHNGRSRAAAFFDAQPKTVAAVTVSRKGGGLLETLHVSDQCFQIIGRQINRRHASGRHLGRWVLK